MISVTSGRRIHFIGIGGAGMSALAEACALSGCRVTGSDQLSSEITERLERMGAQVQYSHDPILVQDADLIVYSSAVGIENQERAYALAHAIPQIRRAEVLGQISRSHFAVCVAGTHGKTTTSSLLSTILINASFDPTVLIGGVPRGMGTNARVGNGQALVTEADEFDRSFLALHPSIAVVTNIEEEHLDCYTDIADISAAFISFVNTVPFYGTAVLCADDVGVQNMLPQVQVPVVTYGITHPANWQAQNLQYSLNSASFTVCHHGVVLGEVTLGITGRHNVLNALATIAVAHAMGVAFESIAESCRLFTGVHRRFEVLGEKNGVTVVDDYAHHPTEIAATIAAARQAGYARIIGIFQPHLYSRTRDFANAFVTELFKVDKLIVLPIYASREKPLAGITSELIATKIPHARLLNESSLIPEVLAKESTKGDLLLFMGAGSITDMAKATWEKIAHGA